MNEFKLPLQFSGNVINLLSVDSIEKFSDGSFAIYVPADGISYPEYVINLRLTDAPKGTYTLSIIPNNIGIGTYDKYNLVVNTEFSRRIAKNTSG